MNANAKFKGFFTVWVLLGMALGLWAVEEPPKTPSVWALAPWTGLGENALSLFSGSRLTWQLVGLGASGAIIYSGLDRSVHNTFVEHPALGSIARPGVIAGALLPLSLGCALWGSGLAGQSRQLSAAGGAVLQSSLLAFSYNVLLKSLTGRPPPPETLTDDQTSREFRFGFMRGGVFWGWPSGHMMANSAAVVSLLAFYRKSTPLKVVGIAYLTYLFSCVVSHDNSSMHWFSDAVTGTVLGTVIGLTVGSRFRRLFEGGMPGKPSKASLQLSPGLGSLTLTLSFWPKPHS